MKFYDIAKRIIDIIGGLVGLIIFSPFILMSVLWVKIVSPKGPVWADTPLRVGKGGNEFRMYKIRSMIPHAHEMMLNDPEMRRLHKESGYKLDPDPRLLPGAKLLRKTSIDEMPQFMNVIKGEMSLVGPRAYYSHELQERSIDFPDTVVYIKELQEAKPGITGPWQVGGRAEIPFPARVKMDAEYAKRRSILYDLWIIIKTPFAVLSQRGSF